MITLIYNERDFKCIKDPWTWFQKVSNTRKMQHNSSKYIVIMQNLQERISEKLWFLQEIEIKS